MLRWLLSFGLLVAPVIPAWAGVVFPSDTDWKYQPGWAEASPADPSAWRMPGFDDSSWETGQAPFYYEDQPGSANASTGNTVLTDMRGNYSCVFLRKTFVVDNPTDVRELQLTSLSDDGFIAWINGAEVVRFNMPGGEVPYFGVSRPALNEPVPLERTILSRTETRLVQGVNVIAVQAFNSGLANSSDFMISVALSTSIDDQAPRVQAIIPPANALVQQLTQVEVIFDEPVNGVDAADLLINGQPAHALTAHDGTHFIFEFSQPVEGTVAVSWNPAHGIRDLTSAGNPFAAGTWSYTLDPHATPPGLIISEFVADNQRSLKDEDGDSSDWIEIFNAGGTTVSLNGYYLTDRNHATQWRFPNLSLLPNTYLVVFASGKDRTEPAAKLHTNFRLSKEGGYLGLLDLSGIAVSEFVNYPPQLPDVSYGRDRGNPNLVAYFPQTTPGAPNAPGGPGFSPPVTFSRSGGSFIEPFALALATDSLTATIRYTLDGSLPTEDSAAYSAPIPVSSTVQVRAQSFTPGLLPGPSRSETYLALAQDALSFSSDLPVIVIHNFEGGPVPASTRQFANLSVFEPKPGRTRLASQPTLSTRAGINLRGSSTMGLPKSSFRVEFWDEHNDDQKHPLLGMPEESDWVLYACNNYEPVLIHNKYMHDLSRQIGRYSPRARFVEVFLNTSGGPITQANYNGVYVLLEKIKRGRDRVDIEPLAPDHSRPPEVTGGYLLSIDRNAPGEGQLHAAWTDFNAQYPNWHEMGQPQRAAQREYITTYINTMTDVMRSPGFADPVNGYAKYIDVEAALDHHILNVLAFNVDALRLSSFLYKPRNGKLIFGPLWDFDRALGSTDGRDANPRIWRSEVHDLGTDMFNPAPFFANRWYSQMFRDIDFWQRWVDRWQELRRQEFALTNLHGLVDRLTGQVREAQQREVNRWPGFTSPRGGSYQFEVNHMKTWLSNRVDFIDTNFLAAPVLSSSGGPIAAGQRVSIAASPAATIYYTVDGTDPRGRGGQISSAARIYSGPLDLMENARVVARARDLNHHNLTGANKPPLSTPWSGPVAATFIVSTPPLLITEVMFNPSPAPGGAGDPNDFEYLELKNVGTQTLDLAGFRFTRGIDYAFTTASSVTSLAPGQYVLLVKNRAAFSTRYPGVSNVAGEYLGSLNNAGERLTLEGPLQEPVSDFTYDNQWYPATDGLGFSLVLVNENSFPIDGSDPAFWRVSSSPGGSPGGTEPSPATVPPILINEALAHTDPPDIDSVELLNPTTAEVDISGWFLTDDPEVPRKFRIPQNTRIPAGGHRVFDASQFGAGDNGFALSSLGDELYLFSGDGSNLTGYSHGYKFEASFNGVSFGRHVTSTGQEKFVAQVRTTLGQANAGPRVGPVVISELMFNPRPIGSTNNTRDEFVEIHNLSAQSVPLYDPATPTNTWRLRGGVSFDFPPNLTLAAQQSLLVVNFDPQADASALAAFSAAYGINPGSVQLLGPYGGNLNNAGDRVALYRPDLVQAPTAPDAGVVPYVLVDELSYANQYPWPAAANGTGQSLQREAIELFGDDPSHWQAAAPTPGRVTSSASQDSDQDGLPDDWEIALGLDPNSGSGPNGPDGDPDGDGMTNLQEYLAGTDPRNPNSTLAIATVQVNPASTLLTFQGAAGKTYSALYRDSLTAGSWLKLADVPARTAAGPITVADGNSGSASHRFYTIVTPANP